MNDAHIYAVLLGLFAIATGITAALERSPGWAAAYWGSALLCSAGCAYLWRDSWNEQDEDDLTPDS